MLMTGHGKTGAGGEEGDDAALPVELNWLSWELGPVSSILSKSQSSPVIKMKSIISLKFSWEIFWKLSVKENDKTNVIFMPSFTHNRWSGDAGWLTKHPPLSRWNQLRNILGSAASKQVIRQMLSLCHHLPTTGTSLLVMPGCFPMLLTAWPRP